MRGWLSELVGPSGRAGLLGRLWWWWPVCWAPGWPFVAGRVAGLHAWWQWAASVGQPEHMASSECVVLESGLQVSHLPWQADAGMRALSCARASNAEFRQGSQADQTWLFDTRTHTHTLLSKGGWQIGGLAVPVLNL